MDETEIKITVTGRASRGKFPVSLMRGEDVLFAGQVNPHKAEDIDAFVKSASKKIRGLRTHAAELQTQLLQLAAPKAAPGPRPPRPPGDHPYSETLGGVFWLKSIGEGDIPVPLLNFTARIIANVERDDGTEQQLDFMIEAQQGERTQTFAVPAAQFGNIPRWSGEHLGAEAIVFAGQGTQDHARAAIQFLSPRPIPRMTVYTHTGWRKLDAGNAGNEGLSQWVYLHAAGAIGAGGCVEEIQVELPGALTLYELPDPPQGDELKAAIRASLGLLDLGPDALIIPVFCAIWRAAMASSDFSLHLAGPTGVFKSELAALAQQHFGPALDARHLPGSWHSTDNALEGLLSAAKDALTVVDDFAPCGGPHDVAKWHQRADRVIRAQGNNAGRGRMRSDGSLRPPKPPRGLVLSTGEEIPRGQSLRARALIQELGKGDILQEMLTRCQKDARDGLYAAAMAGFVRHLAGRYEEMRQSLRAEVEALRQKAIGGAAHCRTPEIIANLALGLRYFIAYAQDAGALTEAEGQGLWNRGWTALGDAANKQANHQVANEPARRFIDLLASAMASGHAHLADCEGNLPTNPTAWGWRQVCIGTGASASEKWEPQGDRIGWLEGGEMLLDPDASFQAAQKMAGTNGDGLTISARTLRKRLDEKGLVIRQTPDELLSRRKVEGRTRNVLILAGGILSAESRESRIPLANPVLGGDSADQCGVPMRENLPLSAKTPHQNPASNPPDGLGNGDPGRPMREMREMRENAEGIPPAESDDSTAPVRLRI